MERGDTHRDRSIAARGLVRRAGGALRRLRDGLRGGLSSENRFLGDLGGRFGTIGEVLAAAGRDARLFAVDVPRPFAAAYFARRHPARRERILAAAEQACAGPAGSPDEAAPGPDLGEDLPVLGQAFCLTSEARYFDAFRARIQKGIGTAVAWPEGDPGREQAAARAVSWVWAYAFFRPEVLADRDLASLLLRGLFAQGRRLAGAPGAAEVPAGRASLPVLVAQLVLGVLFRGAAEADAWKGVALSRLAPEIDCLTDAEGVVRGGSIARQGAVTEMALAALLLAERSGFRLPDLRQRVRAMADFVAHCTMPDGRVPPAGEEGALRLRLPGDPSAGRRDLRHVLALAGCAFDDAALFSLGEERFEAAFWIFGEACAARLEAHGKGPPARVTGRHFARGGFAILRHEDLYALVRSGPVGPGEGAHQDSLSVTLQAGGRDLLVDPGSPAGSDARDTGHRGLGARLRATAAHSTVRVDGQEIRAGGALLDPAPAGDEPARLAARFESHSGFEFVEAGHSGYLTLPGPVRHRRIVLLNRRTRRFVIEDRLEGEGDHRLEWFFHLAPDWEAVLHEEAGLRCSDAGRGFDLRADLLPPGARVWLANDVVTDERGRPRPAQTLIYDWSGRLPVVARFTLDPYPEDHPAGRGSAGP